MVAALFMKYRAAIVVLALLFPVHAAFPAWMTLGGYSDYYAMTVVTDHADWVTNGSQLQNRLEAAVYPTSQLTLNAALRTRLLYGKLYEPLIAFGYAKELEQDPALVDLTRNFWSNNAAICNATFDRLFVDYTVNDWQMRIGRQRINWGKSLVWNPNDCFNAYSPFDVAYKEGPGVDALLLRRYLGPTAQVEVVAAGADRRDSASVAVLVQANRWETDMQGIAGYVRRDVVLGGGFLGQLKSVALHGECSVFMPDTNYSNAAVVATLSSDYTFANQLYLMGSFIYARAKSCMASGTFAQELFSSRLTAKNLVPVRYQLFAQASYPITLLIRSDLSAMVNPYDGSAVVMPLVSFSISDNAAVVLQGMVLAGGAGDQFAGGEQVVFGSFAWNF